MTALPSINDLVVVRERGSERNLRSRVEDSEPGILTIALPYDGMAEHRLPTRSEVVLEWSVKRGVGLVEGTVTGHADIGIPVLVITLTSVPRIIQRREFARTDMVLELEIWPDGDDEDPVPGVTLDVSGGGLRAMLPAPVELGTLVRLSLSCPPGRPIDAIGRVVETRDDGVIAVEFHEIVPADRERLIRAVFASHRFSMPARKEQ